MATIGKEIIQKLAVLRAISLWNKGVYGPVRLQKTLFFADKAAYDEGEGKSIFTFKRYYLGQYSDEIAAAMNHLRDAGKIRTQFDGPSERIEARISLAARVRVGRFFKKHFAKWEQSLQSAFKQWGYLTNDQILTKAHDDKTYKTTSHNKIIFESCLPDVVELDGLSEELAESLADMVDESLAIEVASKLKESQRIPARGEDWRKIYFAGTGRLSK